MQESIEFKEKLRSFRVQIRRHMNGEVSDIMKRMETGYVANYGVSLQHMRDVAQGMKGVFTADDCDALWSMRWRETMLMAVMSLPHEDVSCERIISWLRPAPPLEVIEVMACDLTGRLDAAPALVRCLLACSNIDPVVMALVSYTTARLFMYGMAVDEKLVDSVLSKAEDCSEWSPIEASGLSLLVRQLVRRRLSSNRVGLLLAQAEQMGSFQSLKFRQEVLTEEEFWG